MQINIYKYIKRPEGFNIVLTGLYFLCIKRASIEKAKTPCPEYEN